jgi:hypothetical protein
MPLINTSLPNLLQGVSQQPDVLRYDGQCEKQENAVSSVLKGLQKRPPTEFISKLFDGEVGDADADILKDAFITFIERTDDEKYVVITDGQKLRAFRLELEEGSTTPTEATITVNGVQYTTGYPITADDYIYSATSHQNIKSLTIGDTTLLVNTATAVAKSTDTTPAFAEEALVFVKQGDYQKDYTITFRYPTAGDAVYDIRSGDDNEASHASTKVIRDQFFGVNPHAGGAGATTEDMSAFATRVGDSGLLIDMDNAALLRSGELPISVSVSDGLANTGLGVVHKEVDGITDLPKYCVNGFKVKIRGDVELTQDDYYVKFETTAGQSQGNGSWIETVGPSEFFKLGDGSPVQLVNTAENAFVLRGMPLQGRESGDNDTNPFPSFVSGSINNIFLFKNRIGLLAQDAVIFSEAGFGRSSNGTQYYVNSVGDGSNADGHYYPLYLDSSVIYGDFTAYTFDAFPNTTFYMPDNNSNTAEVSAPTEPSILAFTSETSITVNNSIQGFNFFRTTVTDLLDGDPIDVTVSNREVTNLRAAQPFQENLTIFSDTAQFILKGGDLLTPRTVSISQVTNFDYTKTVEPLPLGSYLYFPFNRGNFTGLREYTINSTTDVYDSDEITQAVPQYIPYDLLSLTGSNSEGLIAGISGNVESTEGQIIDTSYVITTVPNTNNKFVGGGNLLFNAHPYGATSLYSTDPSGFAYLNNQVVGQTALSFALVNFGSPTTAYSSPTYAVNSGDGTSAGFAGALSLIRTNSFSMLNAYNGSTNALSLSQWNSAVPSTFTIEMFCYLSSDRLKGGNNAQPFYMVDAATPTDYEAGIYSDGTFANPNDGLSFMNIDGSSLNSTATTGMDTYASATMHLFLTFDGTNLRLYFNNNLIQDRATTNTMFADATQLFLMNQSLISALGDTQLVYLRVYNYALPSTQRTVNFNNRFN